MHSKDPFLNELETIFSFWQNKTFIFSIVLIMFNLDIKRLRNISYSYFSNLSLMGIGVNVNEPNFNGKKLAQDLILTISGVIICDMIFYAQAGILAAQISAMTYSMASVVHC